MPLAFELSEVDSMQQRNSLVAQTKSNERNARKRGQYSEFYWCQNIDENDKILNDTMFMRSSQFNKSGFNRNEALLS